MDYSDKIKALQHKVGIEANGIATSTTWLNIYHLLFASVPYDLNVNSMIKAIQQQINIRVNGQAGPETWDALFKSLIGNEETITDKSTLFIELHNEAVLKKVAKEMVPFAKELIQLAANQGIHIRLMNGLCDDVAQVKKHNALQQLFNNMHSDCYNYNFGLAFEIGVFERAANGEFTYKDHSPLYAEVAKLGESIGLTWAGDHKTFSSLPYFELRPAWAATMKESEMVKELCRRKQENINLLVIL